MENTLTSAISRMKMKLGILLICSRTCTHVFTKMFVYRKWVFTKNAPKVGFEAVSKAEVDIRLVHSVDISELVKFAKRARFGEERAEEMLKVGHLCFIAEKNGDIVSFVWFCFNEADINELERKMRIEPDSAYAYGAYVVPEHRGIGMFPKVLAEGLGYLFQNGTKRVYTLASHRNSFTRTVEML